MHAWFCKSTVCCRIQRKKKSFASIAMPMSAIGTMHAAYANYSQSIPICEPVYDEIGPPDVDTKNVSDYARSGAYHDCSADAPKPPFSNPSHNAPRVISVSNGNPYAELDEAGIRKQGVYSKCQSTPKTAPVYDVVGLPDIASDRRTALTEKVSDYASSKAGLPSDDSEPRVSEVSYDARKVVVAGNGRPYAALDEGGIQKHREYSKCQSAAKPPAVYAEIGPPNSATKTADGAPVMVAEETMSSDYGKSKADDSKPHLSEVSHDAPRVVPYAVLDEAVIRKQRESIKREPVCAGIISPGVAMKFIKVSDYARSKAGLPAPSDASATDSAATANCSIKNEPVCADIIAPGVARKFIKVSDYAKAKAGVPSNGSEPCLSAILLDDIAPTALVASNGKSHAVLDEAGIQK